MSLANGGACPPPEASSRTIWPHGIRTPSPRRFVIWPRRHTACATALKQAGLDVRVMGPDIVDLPVLNKLAEQPWFEAVGDVDFHSYWSVFDFEDVPGAYAIGARLNETLARYVPEATPPTRGCT